MGVSNMGISRAPVYAMLVFAATPASRYLWTRSTGATYALADMAGGPRGENSDSKQEAHLDVYSRTNIYQGLFRSLLVEEYMPPTSGVGYPPKSA